MFSTSVLVRKSNFKLNSNQLTGKPTKRKGIIFFKCTKLLSLQGLFLALLSGIFYALSAYFVKYMDNLSEGQISVHLSCFLFAVTLPQAVKLKKNVFGERGDRLQLFVSGVAGTFSLILSFFAFKYLPLGIGSVTTNCTPFITTIASRIFLKEPCGVMQSITVALTFLGIFLNSRVPELLNGNHIELSSLYLYGFMAGIGCSLCASCRYFVIRKLNHIPYTLFNFNYACVSVVLTILFTIGFESFSVLQCGYQGFHIISMGVSSFLGETLLTKALQCENAGPVSTAKAASEIFANFLFQIIVFDDVPDGYSTAGSCLIVFCIIFVGLQKWIDSSSDDSIQKKYFKWIIL
ncbi:solute carrier family 35 member G1 [Caerostris darwini]|uniref:Solute carrier family 35 member G1 n=1 Tax=Caerostris darwini TaxID=1538125 RepID=A0AAV4VTA0_9ARAC|nr:solute carrier family 35 member G1 [Caerostris darwini]